MSKGNMLLGHARGKVGDLVFSRSNGEQIVRARAAVVRNPKTEAQIIQRILLNTVSQAYSAFRAITDHSFEGVQTGQPSMSRFMAVNLKNLRARVAGVDEGEWDNINAFTPIGSNELEVNAYTISTGSLPTVPVAFGSGAGNGGHIVLAENTYQGVLDAFGLNSGDQLTFVSMTTDAAFRTTFEFARVILMPNDGDLSSAFVVDGAINKPNVLNEGSFNSLAFADGKLQFKIVAGNTGAAGVIVSRRTSDGTWRRSNCTLTVGNAVYVGHSLLGAIIASEDGGDLELASDRYLNNANNIANGSSVYTYDGKTFDRIVVVNGLVYAVSTDGSYYAIKCNDVQSPHYNKFVGKDNSGFVWSETGASPAFALVIQDREPADDLLYNWLVAQGIPETFFGE